MVVWSLSLPTDSEGPALIPCAARLLSGGRTGLLPAPSWRTVVVHNARELRCGKVLDKLPVLLERMSGMLVRFLDTVQVAHVCFLDQGAFERWTEPTTRGNRRLAGIDLNKARNRHVLGAVVALSTHPHGFALAQLAEAVRERTGWSEKKYSVRQAAYDLAKLRGKKLVRRRDRTRRYESDPSGVRTMCAYLLIREKVIKPLLAGVVRPLGRPPKTVSPLDHHYAELPQLTAAGTGLVLGLQFTDGPHHWQVLRELAAAPLLHLPRVRRDFNGRHDTALLGKAASFGCQLPHEQILLHLALADGRSLLTLLAEDQPRQDHYLKLREELHQTFDTIGLVA